MEQQNILLVDDQPANLVALEALLEGDQRNLIKATSGQEALGALLNFDFALVLLDVQMPGIDGFEVAELMRQHPRCQTTPIIFVTAVNKEQKFVFKGYNSGAVDYLFKPLEATVLRSKVSFFLELDAKKKQLEQSLEASQRLQSANQAILTCAGEGIIGIDTEGSITFSNPAASRLLGRSQIQLSGTAIESLLLLPETPRSFFNWHETPIYQACINGKSLQEDDGVFCNSDGHFFPVEYTATPLLDEEKCFIGAVLVFQDISERKEAERKLVYLAQYDSLTGLANRNLFQSILERAIQRSNRRERPFSLLFLDLDWFKQINDSLGHGAGDKLLIDVANRLQQCTREIDTVSRIGGDEFTIILEELESDTYPEETANRLLSALNNPFYLEGQDVYLAASIGIVNYPNSSADADELLTYADMAMFEAKRKSRNSYQFFNRDMQVKVNEEMAMQSQLHKAIENNELLLYFQPQVETQSGHLLGAEVLLRWQRDKNSATLTPPDQFIPLAERTGLINPIGEWVLAQACRQCSDWLKKYPHLSDFKLSVNLSIRQLQSPGIVQTIEQTLAQTELSANNLEIEITETMLMDDPEDKIDLLKKIRDLGVSIAIDDFGTGYSSMKYLRHLPVDTLKIDKSFISDIGVDKQGEAIVRSMIDLAHSLNLAVVAEGVEDARQLSYLVNHSCDKVQGYYGSAPLPALVLEELLLNQHYSCYRKPEPPVTTTTPVSQFEVAAND